jgi:two-component system sensor histidine kinase EvgS
VISRTLCEMMGGSLQLRSQVGAGTQVEIALHLTTLPPDLRPKTVEATVHPTSTPLNVLVVDDHPANRLLMCQQLEFLGHHHCAETDGETGFEAWKHGLFDLVIVDCNMPVMNGYELARLIRQYEQQQSREACTLLGFTANAQPQEVQRCKHAGMDDCLFKPLSLAALRLWIERVKPIARPAFSLEGLQLLTGGNPKLDQRLLLEVLNSNRLDRQELLDLSPCKDPQSFLDIAHKIKGAARIVQASRLIDSCEALESACREAFHPENVADCTQAIKHAMLELEHALQQQIGHNDRSRTMEP